MFISSAHPVVEHLRATQLLASDAIAQMQTPAPSRHDLYSTLTDVAIIANLASHALEDARDGALRVALDLRTHSNHLETLTHSMLTSRWPLPASQRGEITSELRSIIHTAQLGQELLHTV